MNRDELYHSLVDVNHSREKRAEMATLILDNRDLIPDLLEIAFDVNDPISYRACWVMEFTAKKNLHYLYPYLEKFTSNLQRVHHDSAVRPIAKICEYLMVEYLSEYTDAATDNEILTRLTETQLERITAACFDWLIGDHKVAAQAYSMTCLLLLGVKFEWIHPELKIILEQNYANGSAAYKARARMTLKKIG